MGSVDMAFTNILQHEERKSTSCYENVCCFDCGGYGCKEHWCDLDSPLVF